MPDRALKPQAVRMRNVARGFARANGGAPVFALRNFSCDVAEGEFAVLLGPSGCGKSTAVRMVAGLDAPTSGSVLVNGHTVDGPVPECGMVFQRYTSFPWLSVIDNIAFGLNCAREISKTAAREQARALAQTVGLAGFEDAAIAALSGGMRQRVAIAAALALDPKVLLMDEPFGALDSQTRLVMQEHLVTLVEGSDKTVVFVTHDIEEGLLLGDRIYVCSARPAHVLAEFDVDFPHPRTSATRQLRQFFDLKWQIFNLLRDEAYAQVLERAYARRRRG